MSKGRYCSDNWQKKVEVLGECHFASHKSNIIEPGPVARVLRRDS